jgi:putative FmdB family regulatory protein
MPLHRHECECCGYRFRVLDLEEKDGAAVCPKCGSTDTHRLLPRVSVQFKGSGYYKTDHGRKSNGSGTKAKDEKEPMTTQPAKTEKSDE